MTTYTAIIAFSFKYRVHIFGFLAEVKVILTFSWTMIFMISSILGYNMGTFTPKSFEVSFLHF
jgi:hypothetical protein